MMENQIGQWQRIIEIDDALKTYRVIFIFERPEGKYKFEPLASSLKELYRAIMEYEKQGYRPLDEVAIDNQDKKIE